MKTSLTALALVSASIFRLQAATSVTQSLVSTDGSITIYETSFADSTYYHVDINSDANPVVITGIAVSFHINGYSVPIQADIFPTFSGVLGATTAAANGTGLAAGTYHRDSWPVFFPLTFEQAFGSGTADNGFIWISGENPITIANDLDGEENITLSNQLAFRHNTPNSDFIAFGAGNTVLAGSVVPEPASVFLLGLSSFVFLRRRR